MVRLFYSSLNLIISIYVSCFYTIIVPSEVTFLTAHSTFTSVQIDWQDPFSPNGFITLYQVRYWPLEDPANITTVNTVTPSFSISNLEFGTRFIFEVAAFTRVGAGPGLRIEAGTPDILGKSVSQCHAVHV